MVHLFIDEDIMLEPSRHVPLPQPKYSNKLGFDEVSLQVDIKCS